MSRPLPLPLPLRLPRKWDPVRAALLHHSIISAGGTPSQAFSNSKINLFKYGPSSCVIARMSNLKKKMLPGMFIVGIMGWQIVPVLTQHQDLLPRSKTAPPHTTTSTADHISSYKLLSLLLTSVQCPQEVSWRPHTARQLPLWPSITSHQWTVPRNSTLMVCQAASFLTIHL